VLYILAFGVDRRFGFDNWAHIGGLAGGFAVGYVADQVHSSMPESLWRVIAAVCMHYRILFLPMSQAFPRRALR